MRLEKVLVATFGVVLLAVGPCVNGLAEGIFDRMKSHDDQWTATETGVLASLRLTQLFPASPDPSNAVEGSPAAIELGRQLFNDARFSKNQAVSCASCYDEKMQFQDGLPVGHGVGTGSRRTMPIVGSGYGPWLFWDGRKDSLWAQALGPLEDAAEHGGNRSQYAHLIQTHYPTTYEGVFGKMPDLARIPRDASPTGSSAEQAAWASMTVGEQRDVSRIFSNMGKSIAAYEKTLAHGESRFDSYVGKVVRGDYSGQQILNQQEVEGLSVFIGKGQCVTCHNGPLFTDQSFHNTGVPPRDATKPDQGRAAAIAKVQKDEFNCLGAFSDAKASQCQELRFLTTDDAMMLGAFKTPSLRGVSVRPPYMHAGQFGSIEEVIAHYVRAPKASIGQTELTDGSNRNSERKPIRLSEQEIKALAAFLGTLSDSSIEVAR
jgi:cytochrome c peroxidase